MAKDIHTSIWDLELSIRLHNRFGSAKLLTVKEISDTGLKGLLRIKGFGIKCLAETILALEPFDLHLDLRGLSRYGPKYRLEKVLKIVENRRARNIKPDRIDIVVEGKDGGTMIGSVECSSIDVAKRRHKLGLSKPYSSESIDNVIINRQPKTRHIVIHEEDLSEVIKALRRHAKKG